MIRKLLRLFSCGAVAGAIITVGVAWLHVVCWDSASLMGFSSFRHIEGREGEPPVTLVHRVWSRSGANFDQVSLDIELADFGWSPIESSPESFAEGAPAYVREHLGLDPLDTSRTFRVAEARGWPWLALWCAPPVVIDGNLITPAAGSNTGLPVPELLVSSTRVFPVPRLPLSPIWPGFLFDTLFWGTTALAAWWLVSRSLCIRRQLREYSAARTVG